MRILHMSIAGNELWRLGASISVVAASAFFAWLISFIVKRKIITGAKETETGIDDVIAALGSRPIFWMVFLAGLYGAVRVLVLPDWAEKRAWGFFVVVWGVTGAVTLTRLLNGALVAYMERRSGQEGSSLLEGILKTSRSFIAVVVWLVTGVFIISNLGFDVSAILAGLGIGGVALALASKDTLSNVFGSITILVNGPFRVGEAVSYQGVEGTVEEVGLRDTRIRTWAGHLVVVPNSKAPTSVIENISRRPSFRVLFKLGLHHETDLAKLETTREIITRAVKEDSRTEEKILVHFVEFSQREIRIQVIYYIVGSQDLLETQHDVNTSIARGLAQAEIQLAYPRMAVLEGG